MTTSETTPAKLKKTWQAIIIAGADQSVSTRQSLCSAALEASHKVNFNMLPDTYKGLIASFEACEDYIANDDDKKESDRVWMWLKDNVDKLPV